MISDALERMRSDLREMQSSSLAQSQAPESLLANLVRTVHELSFKLDSGKPPLASVDAEEVWAKWRLLDFDISKLQKRDIRSLCSSPATALRGKFIEKLSAHPEYLSQVSAVFGIVNAYWLEWRSMEEPHEVESLLLSVIGNEMLRKRSKVIREWGKHPPLFSSEAAKHVARILIHERKGFKDVLGELFIDSTTQLARRSQSEAIEFSVKHLVRSETVISEEKCLQEFAWILSGLGATDCEPSVFQKAVAELIICAIPERFPSFKQSLTEVVRGDLRLGDPRLPDKAVNWRSLPEEARDRFVSWIAGETLQFFFNTIVPRNDENRRRAEFWLPYIKRSRNVRDFQVAVSLEDEYKVRSVRTKTMPTYSRMKKWDRTSAFIMVFRGHDREYVVIEFSETNNAAYVYDRKVFEATGVSTRTTIFDLLKDLKRQQRKQDVKLRILHVGMWEFTARTRLAELGIRP